MKRFSSPGPDGISYIILIGGEEVLLTILSILFQTFFNSANLPTQWKTAHIIPVFKNGNRKEAENYRPVSLTSCVCKLMESCIKEEIWSFWSKRDLIKSSQYGFIPHSSCTEQLLQYLDDVTSAVDKGDWVDVVYLDFKKAFNSVPHVRLLCKLSALGIKGTLLNWIRSFLYDKKEVVVVEQKKAMPSR